MEMSSDDYKAKLDYIKSLDPDNPHIRALEKGPGFFNFKLIQKCLDKLPVPESIYHRPDEPLKEKDPITARMDIQLRNQIVQKSKLSNALHLCSTNDERARVSKSILEVDEKIITLLKQKEAYLQGKTLPKVESDKYPVPDNIVDLLAKRNSLRSCISRAKKDLQTMLRTGEDPQKIRDKEDYLHHSKIHLSYVESAVAAQSIH